MSGWSKVEWHADGNRTTRDTNFDLPEALRTRLVLQGIPAVDPRGSFKVSDGESVVTIIGPSAHFLGYLGISYPDGSEPEPGRVRLLQDIVANQLKGAVMPRPETRRDLQRRVDEKLLPAAVVVDDSVVCLNRRAVFMLGGENAEALTGNRLDDFITTAECDYVREQIGAVVSGQRERRFACTIVGLNGTERRVELQCRRQLWRGSVAVEIVIEELARYRNYPDPLIETISEAVWHIKLDTPIPSSAPLSTQIRQIRRKGSLAEANRSFAKIVRAESIERLLGRRVHNLLSAGVEDLITAFVESDYNLRAYEFYLRDAENGLRSFLINATGTVENGRLTDIWGSCSEVADRLEMDRRSVTLQEEQTERIGRDLHDSVAPLLTGMRLLSGDIMHSETSDPANLKFKIEKIANFAEQATDRLGEIYRGLVPRVLEENTLARALEIYAESANELPNVTVRFTQRNGADVDGKDDKIQLYRIVQEAVNNAIKHAEARAIDVFLEKENGRLVLRVCDDGKGFDVDVKKADSLGLQNMRLRANAVGAAFSITSKPGQGTTITVLFAATR